MFRMNFFGRVGYFKELEEISEWAYQLYLTKKDDEIFLELGISPERAKKSFLRLCMLNTKRIFRKFYIFNTSIGGSCSNLFMNFRYGLNVYKKKSLLEGLRNERIFKYCVKSYYKINKTNDITQTRKLLNVTNIRGGVAGTC